MRRMLQEIITVLLVIATTAYSFQPIHSKFKSSSLKMAGGQVPYVPYYPYKGSRDYQWMDIYNALGRERTLFVGRFLDDEACNQLIASLVWLQGQNAKDPITLYFNVPGAIMKPAISVYDVMRRMTCPLITVNMGLTVGIGALLCAVGTSGKRYAFPNSRFLMARTGLEDGIQGQSVDISLAVSEVMKDNVKIISEMSRLCGQPVVKVENDLKRDFYLTAAEAVAYGVIDEVMMPTQPVKMMRYRGEDDDVVNFGHFSEARKVKAGPADVVVKYSDKNDADFDEYTAREMEKKGFPNGRKSDRVDPRSLRNGGGANRFANSRCKPPGASKPKVPPPPGGKKDEFDENPFKNTGW